MDTRVAAVTVMVALPLMPDRVADTVLDPGASEVASPEALTVVTVVSDELQPTELVKSCCEPSLYTPVAVNC